MGCGPEFPDFLGDIVVHEPNSDTWGFGKGALSGTVHSAAVLQSKNSAAVKRKKVKAGGLRVGAGGEMPSGK